MTHVRVLLVSSLLLLPMILRPVRVNASSLDYIFLNEDQFGAETSASEEDGAWSQPSRRDKRWQLVIAPGYSILTHDTQEGIEYRGFFPYRTNGVQYSNGLGIQAGLYYQVNPWFQWGAEGGYSFDHSNKKDLFEIFGYTFLIENTLQVMNVTLNGKVGHWIKGPESTRWRPYVQAGAGWYQVKNSVNLKVIGNQYLYRDQLDDTSNNYMGGNVGAGVEFELYPHAVFGIQGTYHQVFKPGLDLDFFQPGLRLSYLF